MLTIDYEALASWCGECGYELRDWMPHLPSPFHSVSCDISAIRVQALPNFLDDLVSLCSTERLIWIRDWTIWNDRSQEIGLRNLNLLVGDHSATAQAFLLEPAEWRETIALLTVPLLYGWDAHLFFRSGMVLVDISHHGTVTITSRDEADLERVKRWCPSPIC